MQHTVLPNVVQNEYMIACNLHSSYIEVNVLEACNMAVVLYSTYSVLHFKTNYIGIIPVLSLWLSFFAGLDWVKNVKYRKCKSCLGNTSFNLTCDILCNFQCTSIRCAREQSRCMKIKEKEYDVMS